MKAILFILGVLLATKSIAAPLGYMLVPASDQCKIKNGKALFAGNNSLSRPTLDLTKASLFSDDSGNLGAMMTLTNPAAGKSEVLGFIGTLLTSSGGTNYRYVYQAPDTYHDYNRVQYDCTISADRKNMNIKIIMKTAAGKEGHAEIDCEINKL
jgi:hypothetical protein